MGIFNKKKEDEFQPGDVVRFKTDDADFKKYNGRKAEVLYKLSEDDVNHDYHMGDTFRILFPNAKTEIDAFDFELEFV